MFRTISARIVLLVMLAVSLNSHAGQDWLAPSGRAAGVPADLALPFEQYVANTRDNIGVVLRDYGVNESNFDGGYTVEQAARMRSPFEVPIQSSETCSVQTGQHKGFLLIHGLTDSPYLLRGVADSLRGLYPCAVIRAVLLPGHGTVPGDTLDMHFEDWLAITEYGARSLHNEEQVSDVYLVGFSTGTALSIRHMAEGESTDKVKGLIMLSTAVKAGTEFAFLAGWLKYLKPWMSNFKERDAARYESFSSNAGAQFYYLVKDLFNGDYDVDVPVLMAVSADDATINANSAQAFYCNNVQTNPRNKLLWYSSEAGEHGSSADCGADLSVIKTTNEQAKQMRVANVAHTAISTPPDDAHYGRNGNYRECKEYQDDTEAYGACRQQDDRSMWGEKNINSSNARKELEFEYFRRGTFNPYYDELIEEIGCFSGAGTDCD
jgi:esterase/lipase